MYSYREFLDMQEKAFMSSDEKLEKRNIEAIMRSVAEQKKQKMNEDSDIKIYEDKTQQTQQTRQSQQTQPEAQAGRTGRRRRGLRQSAK